MGFLKYQGQIQVNSLENKSIEAKKIMGYIPEIPSLYPNLTVDEHMEFIARAYKLKDYKAYKDALLAKPIACTIWALLKISAGCSAVCRLQTSASTCCSPPRFRNGYVNWRLSR